MFRNKISSAESRRVNKGYQRFQRNFCENRANVKRLTRFEPISLTPFISRGREGHAGKYAGSSSPHGSSAICVARAREGRWRRLEALFISGPRPCDAQFASATTGRSAAQRLLLETVTSVPVISPLAITMAASIVTATSSLALPGQ